MQPMDNLSTIFLREEIKRINNLNKRIDESSFIIEASLDTDTEQILVSDIRGALLKKGISDTVVDEYVDKTLRPNFESGKFCRGGLKCKDFANYILAAFKKSKSKDIHVKLWKRIESLNKTKGALKTEVGLVLAGKKSPLAPPGGSGFKMDPKKVEQLLKDLKKWESHFIKYSDEIKSKEDFKKSVEKNRRGLVSGTFCSKLKPPIVCKDENTVIDTFKKYVGKYIQKIQKDKIFLDTKIINGLLKNFPEDGIKEVLGSNIAGGKLKVAVIRDLKYGNFCPEGSCNNQGGVERYYEAKVTAVNDAVAIADEKERLLATLNALMNFSDSSETQEMISKLLEKYRKDHVELNPEDVANLMDYFDTKIAPRLLKIMGGHDQYKRQINDIRTQLEQEFSEATFCESCKTKEEIMDKATKIMKTFLMVGSKVPEGKSKFDFLQSKLDDLLVINKGDIGDSTSDEDIETISVDELKEFAAAKKGRTFIIKFTPGETIKNKMGEFIDANKAGLQGHFVEHNPGKGYVIFQAHGIQNSGVRQFVIFNVGKGLSYPKTYKKVFIKSQDEDKKWADMFPGEGKMTIKIKDVTKK